MAGHHNEEENVHPLPGSVSPNPFGEPERQSASPGFYDENISWADFDLTESNHPSSSHTIPILPPSTAVPEPEPMQIVNEEGDCTVNEEGDFLFFINNLSSSSHKIPTPPPSPAVPEPEPMQTGNEEEDYFSFLNNLPSLPLGIPELMNSPQHDQVMPDERDQELSQTILDSSLVQEHAITPVVKNVRQLNLNPVSLEEISTVCHLTVKDAADKLQVGQTYLRNRCRDVGIKHWPRVTIENLKNLIDYIHALDPQSNEGDEGQLREIVARLEYLLQERRILELPELEEVRDIRKICWRVGFAKRDREQNVSVPDPAVAEPPVENENDYELLHEEPRERKRSKHVSDFYP